MGEICQSQGVGLLALVPRGAIPTELNQPSGGLPEVNEVGLFRLEGKDHVVGDGSMVLNTPLSSQREGRAAPGLSDEFREPAVK